MDIHVCKQCGVQFMYCRKCVFKPVRYKDAGFCSKECYEASKIKVNPVIEAEPVVEEVLVADVKPIEEEVVVEASVETEVVPAVEEPAFEAATVAEVTPKKETYHTYKKKKK